MKTRPTLIVLAIGSPRAADPAPGVAEPAPAAGGAAAEPGLVATLGRALETGLPVVVVTRPERAARVADLMAWRDIVIVSDSEATMGSGRAIAAGVAERSGAAGWLVMPGEQPRVKPATLLAVAAALAEHPVAVAQYRGHRGHPVGFGAELYSELMRLAGDDGLRRLVARYPAVGVEVDDPGVLTEREARDALSSVPPPVSGAAPFGARLRRTAS